MKKKHKITYQSWLKSHRTYFSSMAHGIDFMDYKIKTSYADLLHSLIFKSTVFLKFLLTLFFILILIFWPHHEKILVPGPGIELTPLQWKYRLLTTEPPRKSLQRTYWEQWFPIFFVAGRGWLPRLKTWPNNLRWQGNQHPSWTASPSAQVGAHCLLALLSFSPTSPSEGREVTLRSCSDRPPAAWRPSPHTDCQRWDHSLPRAPCCAVSASHHLPTRAKKILNIYSFLKHKCIHFKMYQCMAYWIWLLSVKRTCMGLQQTHTLLVSQNLVAFCQQQVLKWAENSKPLDAAKAWWKTVRLWERGLQIKEICNKNGCHKQQTCRSSQSGRNTLRKRCILKWASLVAQLVKKCRRPPAMWGTWVPSLGQEDPRRRKWQPTPVFLPGNSHGQRSLAGYSPRGHKSQTRLSD